MTAVRILAVDDEPDFETLVSQRFRRQIRDGEFEFRFARDGEQALTMLQEDAGIDLMLLDINMPVMDGLTLLSRLREGGTGVRAIIVSAYGDLPNIRTAMNRGAYDFVTKPIDMGDLELTIRKALDEIGRIRDIEAKRVAAERARNNLARYFSPNLVDLLAARDEPLGPVRRQEVAVLFADIVGFSEISERLGPEGVAALLREFYERMADKVFERGGTVEKYIADAVVAVFGVPNPGETDAADALLCAESMLDALDSWNAERALIGEAPLAIGIGLNYGPAVVGDVGTPRSMCFTVVGDMVNTASRLQDLTRVLRTPLLAGDAIVAEVRRQAEIDGSPFLNQLRDAGEHALRGRAKPLRVWKLDRELAAEEASTQHLAHVET